MTCEGFELDNKGRELGMGLVSNPVSRFVRDVNASKMHH